MNLINFNGKLHPADSAIFTLNRAINYGDGMVEGLRIHNGEILFFEDHMDRMFRSIKALKLETPDSFTHAFFHREVLQLGSSRKWPPNARVRIGVFRSGAGLYEPQSNTPEFFIELIPMEKGFEWRNAICEVDVFTGVPKNYSAISFFKSMNALPYVMASIFKTEKKLCDCFLLNSEGNIADAISSNVFWIESGKIFSPPVTEGGVDGVMRKNLIRLLRENSFSVEEKPVMPEQLKAADEVFLTNVGWGIKPVTQFREKNYSAQITHEIFELLMRSLA